MFRARTIKALLAAGAVMVIPALAFAQGSDDSAQQNPSGSEMQQPQQQPGTEQQGTENAPPQQGQQGLEQQQAPLPPEQQQQGAQQNVQPGAQQQHGITKTTRLNENVSFPLVNNCQYTAKVTGTIRPVKTQKGQQEAMLSPNLHVESQVTCPGAEARKVTDTLTQTGPMTRDQLIQALDRHASIATGASGKNCLYVPDFDIQNQKLVGNGVAYLCPIEQGQPGQGQPGQPGQPGQLQQQPAQPQPGQTGMR